MKKELYDNLVYAIMAKPELYSSHKVTVKDGLEVHTFGHPQNSDLAEAKALFKEKGWKIADVQKEAEVLNIKSKLVNRYLTVLYGADKDKISISLFDTGYALAYRKERFYPLRKNTPVFCYTKHMYCFKQLRKKGPLAVRIQTGGIKMYSFGGDIDELMTKILFNVTYKPRAEISYRHLINTKDDFQGLSNMFGVRIPEALKQFSVDDVTNLYKTIKDYNQINKLCQFIAKGGAERAKRPDSIFGDSYLYPNLSLHETIAKMLFGERADEWLIRDTILDCVSLKLRSISLNVTSRKRWSEDHQRMTKLRMLKGVPKIKVDDIYKGALVDLEHPYELIETKERLIQESVELHHCVATYAHKINNSECAIFSIEHEGKRYTLEVGAHKVKDGIIYKLLQFRGLCNVSAPVLLEGMVIRTLLSNSAEETKKEPKFAEVEGDLNF